MGESTSKHRGSDSENGGRDRIPISPPILGVANAPKKWKPSPAPRATCQLPDFKAIKEIWQEQGWGRDMTNRYQKLTASLARPFNLESGPWFLGHPVPSRCRALQVPQYEAGRRLDPLRRPQRQVGWQPELPTNSATRSCMPTQFATIADGTRNTAFFLRIYRIFLAICARTRGRSWRVTCSPLRSLRVDLAMLHLRMARSLASMSG